MDFHHQDTNGIRLFLLVRSADVNSHIQTHALGLDKISCSCIDLRHENRVNDWEIEKIQSPWRSNVHCGINLGFLRESKGYVLQKWKIYPRVSTNLSSVVLSQRLTWMHL